jgi:hypothetical protein
MAAKTLRDAQRCGVSDSSYTRNFQSSEIPSLALKINTERTKEEEEDCCVTPKGKEFQIPKPTTPPRINRIVQEFQEFPISIPKNPWVIPKSPWFMGHHFTWFMYADANLKGTSKPVDFYFEC